MRTIGLLGGMSWVSTGHYYDLMNRDVAERLGGDHCAPMVVWQMDFDVITAHQRAGEWELAGELLAEGAAALVRAGAEVIGIGANTMHLVADAVAAALGDAELVHIVEVVRDACAALDVTTLGLLGTAYTMESPDLYPPRLAAAGIELVVPDADDRAIVQRVTFDELIHDVVTESAVAEFRRIGAGLVDAGAGAVVLACTEQGAVLRDGELDVPVLDSTVLHARALVDAAIGAISPA
ncbi:aspartate/glutamate racemase family protein [Dermatobacter hominis]|uniref:aspartate/glutamate racemase family protein n=1 Tax=Dermatobacter hominis TaxID=2884263 RepID=UPI001D12E416|nr:amino acid racemase [Dermatobacter hominis]UDY35816.1 amino acid racemase [Dermatobacter hominis]